MRRGAGCLVYNRQLRRAVAGGRQEQELRTGMRTAPFFGLFLSVFDTLTSLPDSGPKSSSVSGLVEFSVGQIVSSTLEGSLGQMY